MMAFIQYMTKMLFSLVMSANMMMFISRGQASANRVSELLKEEPYIINRENALKEFRADGDIEFHNVSFAYGRGGDPVLKGLSFRIRQGESVAILGATGSGKSSLINLIPRFYDVTEGSITINGVDIRNIDLKGAAHEYRNGFAGNRVIFRYNQR